MDKRNARPGTGDILRFLIPSLIGAIAFLVPFSFNGTINTFLGVAIDWGKSVLKAQLPFPAMVIVCLSALITLYSVIFRPRAIREKDFLRDLFMTTPFWTLSRLAGALY